MYKYLPSSNWKTFIYLSVEDTARKSVDKKVRLKPPVIFPDVLDSCHCQHEYDRN